MLFVAEATRTFRPSAEPLKAELLMDVIPEGREREVSLVQPLKTYLPNSATVPSGISTLVRLAQPTKA